MIRRCVMSKYVFAGLLAMVTAGALHIHAQTPARSPRDAAGVATACAQLTGRSLDGSASVTAATFVTGGTLTVSPTVTLTNLPPFCRVQGVSKPSLDSNIV